MYKVIKKIVFLIIILVNHMHALRADNYLFTITIYCDSTENKNVAEIRNILQNKPQVFQPFNPGKSLLSRKGSYWLYLKPLAKEVNKEHLVLSVSPRISLTELYLENENTPCGYGGLYVNRNKKNSAGNTIFMPTCKTGYFIKIQNHVGKFNTIRHFEIIPESDFFKRQSVIDFFQGILQGFFWLMLLANFAVFLANKQRLQLFYVIYILMNSLYLLFIFNYSETLLFPFNYKINLVLKATQLMGVYFYSIFLRQLFLRFCNTYNDTVDKKLFKPFCYLILILNFSLSSTLFYNIYIFEKFIGLVNIIEALLAISAFIYYRKGFTRFLNIVIIGSVSMMIGGILSVTDLLHVYPDMILFEFGLIVELLLFTYMLGMYHLQILKQYYEAEHEKITIQQQLELKNRELVYQTLQLSSKEEFITSLKTRIEEYKKTYPGRTENLKIIEKELVNNSNNNVWKEFEHHFNEIHPGFYKLLAAKFPELTQSEVKLCAFIKLNLNTKEIASITQKTSHSIEVMRSRIRQKMNIAREDNLTQVLSQIKNDSV